MILSYTLLFLFQILLIIFLNYFSPKIGIIDEPDSRKIHYGKIPLTGGIGIAFTILLSILLFDYSEDIKLIFYVSMILLIVGFIDDIFKIGIITRIIFQFIACSILLYFDMRIVNLGIIEDSKTDLYFFAIFLTFLTVIAFTNAINFIDGLDGLAIGNIILCLLSIIIFSFFNDQNVNLNMFLTLFLVSLIFLMSNFKVVLPKSFLGNSGSMFFGFFLSYIIIYYTLPNNRNFHPILTIWCAPYVVFEFIGIFICRVLFRKNPFKADRRHMHYKLNKFIKNQNLITLIILFSSFILSIIGLLLFTNFGIMISCIIYLLLLLLYSFFLYKLNTQ